METPFFSTPEFYCFCPCQIFYTFIRLHSLPKSPPPHNLQALNLNTARKPTFHRESHQYTSRHPCLRSSKGLPSFLLPDLRRRLYVLIFPTIAFILIFIFFFTIQQGAFLQQSLRLKCSC